MRIVAAVFDALLKYATFSGTTARFDYWAFVGFVSVGFVTLYLISPVFDEVTSLTTLWLLALGLPILAASSRRAHDAGRFGSEAVLGVIALLGVTLWRQDLGATGGFVATSLFQSIGMMLATAFNLIVAAFVVTLLSKPTSPQPLH